MKIKICVFLTIAVLIISACSEPVAKPAAPQPQDPADMVPKLGINSLVLNVQSVQGDSSTKTAKINFMNEGEGVMIWAARSSASWIWLNEISGALEKGYSKALDVFIAPMDKGPGTYSENITIEGLRARNSPQNVVVTLVIKPKAAGPAGTDAAVAAKPVPEPPWSYNEYYNNNYHFRIRYPKEYMQKPLQDAVFGAVANAGQQQVDSIRVEVTGSYGVDYRDATMEWAKAIRLSGGGASPKLVSSDNATNLLDGVTPAFEMLYDAKSSTKISSQVYIFGVKKGSRYIMFGAVAASATAPERLALWKEIARTLEFVDKD